MSVAKASVKLDAFIEAEILDDPKTNSTEEKALQGCRGGGASNYGENHKGVRLGGLFSRRAKLVRSAVEGNAHLE